MKADKNYSQKIGIMGENIAAEMFRKKGYTVIERNFHSRFGEIDIISKGNGYIVFAEVKMRSVNSIARPAEFVDFRKQKKIIMTAQIYISRNKSEFQPRFDVVEILYEPKTMSVISIEHIENAFDGSAFYG